MIKEMWDEYKKLTAEFETMTREVFNRRFSYCQQHPGVLQYEVKNYVPGFKEFEESCWKLATKKRAIHDSILKELDGKVYRLDATRYLLQIDDCLEERDAYTNRSNQEIPNSDGTS